MSTRDILIPGGDGASIPATVWLPDVLPAPAVVMAYTVYGLNEDTRWWAERYARNGFILIAPDLFWRTIPGVLNADVPEERARSRERTERFDHELGIADVASVRDFARSMPEANGKWAVAGYCFGGRYALVAGGELGADAIVAFHPSRMEKELAATAAIACPMSFHCGEADEMTPAPLLQVMRELLSENPDAQIDVYPGARHGFTGHDRPAYDEVASETAYRRALRTLEALK